MQVLRLAQPKGYQRLFLDEGESLSERERDMLKLVAVGLATEEVAQELAISIDTLHTHLKHIYGKLDAHNRVHAMERARALNLV
ncbi:MAG: helix-turn-helix transcriptional regulator [Anaerolineae bacterium]|nr:helix-turn-helix transcriptional regulator [Anaerolineae bacterium]